MSNYFFSADYHLGHKNIMKYCNRPFDSVEEMDETIINSHNKIIGKNDIFIHAGDFCLFKSYDRVNKQYIQRLNGKHMFLMGSHDEWLSKLNYQDIWKRGIGSHYIVVCHYLMRVWPLSHYGSWHLYGHSHGNAQFLEEGKQLDIGWDLWYKPLSIEEIKVEMDKRPENPNLISRRFE